MCNFPNKVQRAEEVPSQRLLKSIVAIVDLGGILTPQNAELMRYEMNRMRYYLNFAKKESKISAETVKDTYDLAPCLSVLVDLFQ